MKKNKKILVEISYIDFEFDDIEKAVAFANTASEAIQDDKDIKVTITFEEDE